MNAQETQLVVDALELYRRADPDKAELIDALLKKLASTTYGPPIIVEHRGYRIVPKQDFGPVGYFIDGKYVKEGFVVMNPVGHEYAMCNAMPGACWFRTVPDATHGIDVLIETGGGPLFWKTLHGETKDETRASAKVQASALDGCGAH